MTKDEATQRLQDLLDGRADHERNTPHNKRGRDFNDTADGFECNIERVRKYLDDMPEGGA